MRRDSIRSVAVFLAVTAVLILIVVGGIRFAKDSNATYAAQLQHSTSAAATPNTASHPTASSSSSSSSQQPRSTNGQVAQTPAQQAPHPSQNTTISPESSPSPTPTNINQQAANNGTTTTTQLPSTGPSLTDMLITCVLIMVAIYFALLIRRAHLSYKQLLS